MKAENPEREGAITMRNLLCGLLVATPMLWDLGAEKERETWIPLFDGETLDGWRSLDGKPVLGWKAEDGVLRYVPPKPGEGGHDLYTSKEYSNFVLDLEWKIAPRGNSGVKYRMSWYGDRYLGPEYQILGEDPSAEPVQRWSKNLTGSLYDLIPIDLEARELKPPGEWNHTRIVADHRKLEHWLNHRRLLQVDLGSERFHEAVQASKFRSRSGFAQNESGRIMLQDHGWEVEFRNIRIRLLP
jgi:hypothetical protein